MSTTNSPTMRSTTGFTSPLAVNADDTVRPRWLEVPVAEMTLPDGEEVAGKPTGLKPDPDGLEAADLNAENDEEAMGWLNWRNDEPAGVVLADVDVEPDESATELDDADLCRFMPLGGTIPVDIPSAGDSNMVPGIIVMLCRSVS